jgi:3-oxoadipate enol-lactonase
MSLGFEEEGDGPALIMVHGLGGSSNCFQPQARKLAKQYRVIRPDLPGAGRSMSNTSTTIVDVADELVKLLAQLKISSAHWVGHSLGSVICQVVALQHQTQVRSLALLGPISELPPSGRSALRSRAAKVHLEGLSGIVDPYIATALATDIDETNPVAGAFLRECLLRQSPHHYAKFCLDLAQHDAVPLHNISVPLLLITGDQDKTATVESVTAIAKKSSNATLIILKDCGHWSTIERPSEVTSAVDQHLRAATASQ